MTLGIGVDARVLTDDERSSVIAAIYAKAEGDELAAVTMNAPQERGLADLLRRQAVRYRLLAEALADAGSIVLTEEVL